MLSCPGSGLVFLQQRCTKLAHHLAAGSQGHEQRGTQGREQSRASQQHWVKNSVKLCSGVGLPILRSIVCLVGNIYYQ